MHRELIARVEKCTGPDRRLDVEIERWLLGLKGRPWTYEHVKGEVIEFGTETDGYVSWCHTLTATEFTASLDSVVALVERELPGSAWQVTKRQNGTCGAIVQKHRGAEIGGFEYWVDEDAPTPALALLLAFLRAKSNQEAQ